MGLCDHSVPNPLTLPRLSRWPDPAASQSPAAAGQGGWGSKGDTSPHCPRRAGGCRGSRRVRATHPRHLYREEGRKEQRGGEETQRKGEKGKARKTQ